MRCSIPNAAVDFGEYQDFGAAAEGVMGMLQELLGLEVWFVTRIRLDEWIITHLRGSAPFAVGDPLPVSLAMRAHILRGRRPASAGERTLAVLPKPLVAAEFYDARNYVGTPLVVNDQLFGVLCGLDAAGALAKRKKDAPHLMTAARVLSTILAHDLDAEKLLRRAERAEADALIDELTGLFNRRAWERLVEREEARSLRYGHAATVFMMDVDGLKGVNDEHGHATGDDLLRDVAEAVRSVVREHDVPARIGGDEFALLAVETDPGDARVLLARLEAAFEAANLRVSVGTAHRNGAGGISAAVDRADAAMYRRKAERQATSLS